MNDWHTYARRNEAFTQKHKGKVLRALNIQVKRYADSYKQGRPDITLFNDNGQLIQCLLDIYGDVGGYFARTTNRELRRGLRLSAASSTRPKIVKVGNGASTGNNSLLQKDGSRAFVLKRAPLGFSTDWANRLIDRLRISAINLAQRISAYTRQKVLDILTEAQTENLSLDETVQRIVSEVGELNARRAETIARTEVGRAAGEGKMIGAKALGVEMDKVWISARDNRTRHGNEANHWVLNEQVRPMDEPFSDGINQIMQPGDPKAPAAETVNCRCTVVFKVRTDANGQPIQRQYLNMVI